MIKVKYIQRKKKEEEKRLTKIDVKKEQEDEEDNENNRKRAILSKDEEELTRMFLLSDVENFIKSHCEIPVLFTRPFLLGVLQYKSDVIHLPFNPCPLCSLSISLEYLSFGRDI